MANVQESLHVVLTGERIDEFDRAKEILLALGVEGKEPSNQRVVSAALQVLIGFHGIGGVLSYRFDDARYGPRRAKRKSA